MYGSKLRVQNEEEGRGWLRLREGGHVCHVSVLCM
jgi:hypothetical protein